MDIDRAKRMCFSKWLKEQPFLQSRVKCADYGRNYTQETVWNILPSISKEYWLNRML